MTFDIDTDDTHLIRMCVESRYTNGSETHRRLMRALEPICTEDERIVMTVDTFRSFHDSSDEETRNLLDSMSDEELEPWVPDLYDDWASRCNLAAEELVYAARKKKEAAHGSQA